MPVGVGRYSDASPASEDRRLYTVAIDITAGGAGNTLLWTPPVGTRFAVYYLSLRVSAAMSISFKSGTATDITGPLSLTATGAGQLGPFHANGLPILIGRSVMAAVNSAEFYLTTSAAGDIDGWAIVGALAGAGPS